MPDTLSREEQRDERVAALLERIGYFWGGSYLNDPNVPTWGWLRSDGAGNAVPVTDPEQALIDLVFEKAAHIAALTAAVEALPRKRYDTISRAAVLAILRGEQ